MTYDLHLTEEEELFAALGGEILSETKMGRKVSKKQKSELGKSWLKGHLSELKKIMCGNSLLEDLSTSEDTTAFLAAITPLLSFSPTTAASSIIAILISRIGFRRICKNEWG
ncbi:hypothetical protein ACLBX9_07150 [Methylobacterium sp. A49B]